MTPSKHREFVNEELEKQKELAANWHHPLSEDQTSLYRVLDSMQEFKLCQEDVPLVVKLTENPDYATSKLLRALLIFFLMIVFMSSLGVGCS